MTLPAIVVLSDHDTDIPNLPACCTTSKDREKAGWDHGGYDLGVAAAAAGRFWLDRPYRPGAIDRTWMVSRCRAITSAGGWCQAGNEPRQEWPGGVRPYCSWLTDCLNDYPEGNWVLAPLGDPLSAGWRTDLDDPGYRALGERIGRVALHAYGDADRMIAALDAYLAAFPTAELVVTEFNPGAGNRFDLDRWAGSQITPFLDHCHASGRVRMASYFAWQWDQSPSLPNSVDARGSAVPTVLREWRPRAYKEPTKMLIDMVDLSNNNGAGVPLDALKAAGVRVVGMKASQGRGYRDETFPIFWPRAADLGLGRLAYCFMNPDNPDLGSTGDEDETSGLFARQIESVGGPKPTDLIALDCEAGSGNRLGFVARTLELMEDRCGVRPGKYSARWWTRAHGVEHSTLSKYWTWWANYEDVLGPLPVGWENPLIWQTGVGPIPGVTGDFDLDRLLVPVGDLLARGYRGGNDVIQLSDADKAAYLAATGQAWGAAEQIAAILAKYGAEGQSAAEWVDQGIKAPIVLSKELTGTNR